MLLGSAVHQTLGQPGSKAGGRGEAKPEALRDEARPARQGLEGSGRDDLLTQALASANMVNAWKRVKANRGSAGVDGRTIAETAAYLRTHWPGIREALLNGSYRPEPVRRVQIPKAGGGMRELGIPTVTDRLIQQALLQVLQPMIDPTFSEHSFGFRPGRRAHDAVLTARRYVQDGYRMVVDVDLEKFFDRVNHDILMERLSRRIDDKAVLRLIRRYLVAGIMDGGVVMQRYEGTPQGGPFTPRTQKITSSSIGKFPFIVLKRHLICVAGGHMLKAHVARHRFRKGTTGEQRLRSACSWSQPQRGRASIDRIIRVVASPGLSIPAGGTGTRAAAAGCPTDHSRHDQNPRRGRGGVARVCSRKRPDDGRDCWVRGIGVSGQGTPTWLIGAGRVMTCIWTMSLTACSPPSLSKSTRSWYRIGHAARGGRPG
jgi:hypothetical protein